ncbi:MAG: ABC transporter ATP-binding protein [Deltaproteobacteria bacterium]|nr:ABC transporter ATP-binding protein [Deltaproteobacteria bacterium]
MTMTIEITELRLALQGRPVLNGINLSMREGDIYGLLGENGAGKSTALSVVTGLRAAGSGKVAVLGLDPVRRRSDLHRAIGVLPEQGGFYDWMSATDYLRWFAGLYGLPLPDDAAGRLLDRVGLDPGNPRPVRTYSHGMKQRLGLARAMMNNPRLLILDEPTNGLDPGGRRDIHDVLLDLNRRHGVAILLCTHLLDDVERLCSRIGIIHRGKTVLEGSMAALMASPRAASRYRLRLSAPPSGAGLPADVSVAGTEGEWLRLNIPAGRSPDSVWRALYASGWGIVEIHNESGGLSDLYLNLIERENAS